jgi:hypothetical protein
LLWAAACVPLSSFLLAFFWDGVPPHFGDPANPESKRYRTRIMPSRRYVAEGDPMARKRTLPRRGAALWRALQRVLGKGRGARM